MNRKIKIVDSRLIYSYQDIYAKRFMNVFEFHRLVMFKLFAVYVVIMSDVALEKINKNKSFLLKIS